MSAIEHCADLGADRNEGTWWEKRFGKMALDYGRTFTGHQWHANGQSAVAHLSGGRRWTLPDVTIWTSPGEHHEIKHKDPASRWWAKRVKCYGLEVYRFDALLEFRLETRTPVFYTIHDHAIAAEAGRPRSRQDPRGRVNDIADWRTVEILRLDALRRNGGAEMSTTASYVNGQRHENVPNIYWPVTEWIPLAELWARGFGAKSVADRDWLAQLQRPGVGDHRWWVDD